MKLNSNEFDEEPFENIVFVSEQLEKEIVERQRELYRSAAFSHWLRGTTKRNFNDFCTMLGLIENKNGKLTEKQKDKIRKKADAIADKIMKAQRKGKYAKAV